MESRLRLLIVLAGLPEPKVDHKFYDEHGRVRRRLDLRYLVIRLIVEYDGRQHAGSLEHWGRTWSAGRSSTTMAGGSSSCVRGDGIYKYPEQTLLRIRRQLVARGWPKVPPLGDGWRVHFPGR